jgi:hypothetical protein
MLLNRLGLEAIGTLCILLGRIEAALDFSTLFAQRHKLIFDSSNAPAIILGNRRRFPVQCFPQLIDNLDARRGAGLENTNRLRLGV